MSRRVSARPLLWAALPLGLGAIITALLVPVAGSLVLVQQFRVAWLPLVVGALVAAVLAVVVAARLLLARAEERGRACAARDEHEQRRRFVARLDHEIKNPLTAIRLGLSNLEHEASDPAAGIVRGLDTQAQRLSRLLADLRKLGELESVELEIAPVDLEEVAREVAEAVAELPETAEREIALSFPRAPRPLPAVAGDADLLFLAVYNLVANAVRYTSPGDRIEVRGAEGDGVVTLEVADTGPGIPSEEQSLVWEELARGSRTRAVPGSGLGLPLVRAIVLRHGGGVELRSRDGQGTVMRVRLPV